MRGPRTRAWRRCLRTALSRGAAGGHSAFDRTLHACLTREARLGGFGELGAEIKWRKIRGPTMVVQGRIPGVRGRLVRVTDAEGVRIFHEAPGKPLHLVGRGQMREAAEAQAKRTLGVGSLSGSLGAFWLDDPRLPDDTGAQGRVFGFRGEKRPPREPHNTMIVAKHFTPARPNKAPLRFEVTRNRRGTRWWFSVTIGHAKPDHQFSRPDEDGNYYTFTADRASTSSPRVAQGWIDALTKR